MLKIGVHHIYRLERREIKNVRKPNIILRKN